MSFGLDIEVQDLDGNTFSLEVVDGHTYNLRPMWDKALPFLNHVSDLDGLKCGNILEYLDAGLLDATKNADEYRALNPANGWGDYGGFYEVFAEFVRMCNQFPSGNIRWNG